MKKKLLFTLASSLLCLGISSCGINNSGDSSTEIDDSSSSISNDSSSKSNQDNSSSNQEENFSSSSTSEEEPIKNGAVKTIIDLLKVSNNLDDSKLASSTLNVFGNEWRSVEKDGITTHKITRYEGQRNTLTFFKNNKAIVETEDITSNTDDTETVTKYQNVYGEANGLFIDLFCDYEETGYEAKSQKSSSKEIVDNSPKEGEISRDDANTIYKKGVIVRNKENSNGVISFLLNNYFSNNKVFANDDAVTNATLKRENNKYTFFSTIETKDDVENPLIEEYTFDFTFDEEGYLLNANGSITTYATTNNEKGLKSFEYVINLTQTIGEKVDETNFDFDSYFYSRPADVSITFSTTYLGESVDISEINKKYYVNVTSKKSTVFPTIDKVKLFKVTRNGNEADSSDYLYEDDGETKTLTLKKGGDYSFFFKTTKIEEIEKTATIQITELTSLKFIDRRDGTLPGGGYVGQYNKDNEYLPNYILAGDTQFSLEAEPSNATDDVEIEILNNDIGATISKVDGTPFTYKLVTSQTGKITIKATSATLGEEKAITKEVNVYANTDEGISSFLSDATWYKPTTTSTIDSLSFTAAGATNGTFEVTGSLGNGYTASGNYSVENGSISFETTEQSNSKFTLKSIKVESGRGDIIVSVTIPQLMQN